MAKRYLKTVKLSKQGQCFTVIARNAGSTGPARWEPSYPGASRAITYRVCLVGPPPQSNLSISRGARRGGIRASDRTRGGFVVCPSTSGLGRGAKCFKGKDVFIFPGGTAKYRKNETIGPVLGGARRKRSR